MPHFRLETVFEGEWGGGTGGRVRVQCLLKIEEGEGKEDGGMGVPGQDNRAGFSGQGVR